MKATTNWGLMSHLPKFHEVKCPTYKTFFGVNENVPLILLSLGLTKMSHLYMLLLIGYECPTFTLFIGVKSIPQLCKLPLNTLGMNVPLKQPLMKDA